MLRLKYILFALLVGSATLLHAQLDRSKAPEPGPAPKIELGDYEKFTLPNGLTVLVVENHKYPKVSFRMVLDIDPVLEGNKTGMMAITGDLLTEGTRGLTNEQLAEEVDFMGASLSASATSVSASGLSRYKDDLVRLMSEVIKYPTFPEASFEKVVNQYLAAIEADKKEPKSIAANLRNRLLFGKEHPYGDVMTETSLKSVSIADCKDFYQQYFKPNVAYLAIVGDVTLKEVKKLTKKYLSDWEKGDVADMEYRQPELIEGKRVVLSHRDNAPQSYILITHTLQLPKGHPDVIPLSVMNSMLGSGFTGLLFKNLREDKGYTYGAYSSLGSDRLTARFTVASNVRADVTDSSFIEIRKEINYIKDDLLEQDHLDMTKATLAGNFSRSLEHPSTIARFALNIERFGIPKDYFETYLEKLSKVTLEDVKDMGEKYLTPDSALYIVVGNRDLKDKLKTIDSDGVIEEFDYHGDPIVE